MLIVMPARTSADVALRPASCAQALRELRGGLIAVSHALAALEPVAAKE
jgi:hypothetical protein